MLLFLSHAGVDSAAALRLAGLIEGSGLKVWIDKRDLAAGQGWQKQLEDAIETRSTAFAVYVGSSGVMNWVESEVRLGLSRATGDSAYPFIPILGPHCEGSKVLPAFARQYQGVRDPEGKPDELQKLVRAALRIEGMEPVQVVTHPFLGLRAFEEHHAHLFFGRREETKELVERLGKTNLLMVVGDSGSGKSSLVKAGLVPAFRGGALADRRGGQPDETVWHVLQMRPRGNPFEQLIEAATAGVDAATGFAIADRIRTREAAKVGDALTAAAPPKARLLLVVDQFEELWTLTPEAEREAFINVLLGLAPENDDRRRIVLTMRRDYYNLCSALPDLYRRLENPTGRAKYSVRRMSDAGLRACITEPLKLGGVKDAAVFAEEVLRDVGDEPADLALLEMALTEAWRRHGEFGGDLLQAYIGSGRVAGALAQAADRVFEERLKKEPLDLVKSIFIRLVRLGDTGGTTRRVASRDEFGGEAWRIVQDLASEDGGRLLQIGGEEGREAIELSHEALVTQWPQYQTWLEEFALDKRAFDALIADAKRWAVADTQKAAFLAAGYDLLAFWRVRLRPGANQWLSATEIEFIDASEAARKAELERQEREERRRKTMLRLTAATTLLASAAAIVAFYFWNLSSETLESVRSTNAKLTEAFADLEIEKQNVESARQLADERSNQLRTSVGHLLGATAQRLLESVTEETAPAVAALASAGWRLAPNADAWNATQRLSITGSTLAIPHDGWVNAVAFSADGRLLATGSQDHLARLIDTASGSEVARVSHDNDVMALAFSPDGRLLATGSLDNSARLTESPTGKEVARVMHDGAVVTVAFSPDGSLLATGSWDGNSRLIEVPTGKEIARVTHGGVVMVVAFSPDGRLLATGSQDNEARLIETATGIEIAHMSHEGPVIDLAFSRDGRLLATGSQDKSVRLTEVATGKEVARLKIDDEVNALAFSPDGRRLAVAGLGNVRLIDAATGMEVARAAHEGRVTAVAFSPDGRLLATACQGKGARIIEATTGELLARINQDVFADAIAFSPDGRLLATGGWDKVARLTEVAAGKEVARIVYDYPVFAAAFSPDGRLLATGNLDSSAWLVKTAGGEPVMSIPHSDAVAAIAFSPDGHWLATGSHDNSARLIEATTGKVVARIIHDGRVDAVAFGPDGRLLATGSLDGSARLIEVATGKEVGRVTHDHFVNAIAFSPDGRWLATGSSDGSARLIEAATAKEAGRVSHGGPVFAVAFSPDGRWLATGSADKSARLIEVATREVVARVTHDGTVNDLAFSPDSRWLATGGEDKSAQLIEVATGKTVARVSHDGPIYAVAFSPDGRSLATGSSDRSVRLIEAATGKTIARITHDDFISAVAFSPDGRLLATASGTTVRLWSTDVDDVFRRLCQQRGLNLSLEAWRGYVGDQPWQPTCDCWDTPPDVVAAGLWPPKDRELNCPMP